MRGHFSSVVGDMEWRLARAGSPVDRLGREGEAGVSGFDDAHDFKHEFLLVGHVRGFCRAICIGDDGDIEARCAKTVKSDEVGWGINLGVVGEVFFNAFDNRFELLLSGRIENAEAAVHFSAFSPFEVVDVRICEHLIWHHDDGVFDSSYDGRTQADFFDGAFDAIERDPVADVERMVEEDDERTEEVREGIF